MDDEAHSVIQKPRMMGVDGCAHLAMHEAVCCVYGCGSGSISICVYV